MSNPRLFKKIETMVRESKMIETLDKTIDEKTEEMQKKNGSIWLIHS